MFQNINWFSASKRSYPVALIYKDHYSSKKNRGSIEKWMSYGITGPGESIVLMTSDYKSLFVWLHQIYTQNGQRGVNCAVFRNESNILSSQLILEAEEIAWGRFPGARLFTYVDQDKILSPNPGYCFKMAGWRLCGKTARGLHILEKLPGPGREI